MPPTEPDKTPKEDGPKIPFLQIGLLAAALLYAMNSGGGGDSTFSYTVSSFSQTTVTTIDDSGKPQYDTKRTSSFQTNIPGLAEKLAEQGSEPADLGLFPLLIR